jgi:Ohr subfamily peroxiredoxin
MTTLYTAKAHITGGRDGRATSADGHPDLQLKPPPEMGGPADQPDATNPEELFALGYGACFLGALNHVCGQEKIGSKDFTIDTAVSIHNVDGTFDVSVELHGTLPGIDDEQAKDLLRRAHEVCPYSRATRGNIDVGVFLGDEPV